MSTSSRLRLGLIPQGTACPFRDQCSFALVGSCKHQGETHPCDFSCATARFFDMALKEYHKPTQNA